MVRDTPPYGHAPTYQISLTYLERQKRYGPDKLCWEEAEEAEEEVEEKIRLKQYVSLRSKERHNYQWNVDSYKWLLFNPNSAIYHLYNGENKLIFNEIMKKSALY